ncbi:MAG: hypothetical protein K2O24_05765 [Muribaculaceae bacterium]|nr:hypothetical protein [Muribaculaceae bacterium]
MEDRKKVNSYQLYMLWKNLALSLAIMIGVVVFTRWLPFFLAPAVALLGAVILYTMLFNHRSRQEMLSCILMPYTVFYCLLTYTFVSIIVNVLYAWGFIMVPGEFIFLNHPYLPNLYLMPLSFVVTSVIYFRRGHLRICDDCRSDSGSPVEKGIFGVILRHETAVQLKNLIFLFGILSVVLWIYYIFEYVNINQTNRDWYVFAWIAILAFFLDELYFAARFYNLYLDLKESDEIITPEELKDMTAKTYLRLYVICGNRIYIDNHSIDPTVPFKEVIDTPFETRRTVNGIPLSEVKNVAKKMTGHDGELRFFFGRRLANMTNHSVLRYFYFIDDEQNCPVKLNSEGKWIDFDEIQKLYATSRGDMSSLFISDMTRLATIILTEKTYDERGNRRSRLKTYKPSFSLKDVRDSDIDFQDDKWLKVSEFNAGTRFFRLKRWWRSISGADRRYNV